MKKGGTFDRNSAESDNGHRPTKKNMIKGRLEEFGKGRAVLITLGAITAGFCNAVLGAGGGIVLTLTLGAFCSDRFSDRRALLSTSQAAMIPCCILSCIIYYFQGRLDTTSFSVFAIPALLGGIAGGLLLNRIKSKWIVRLFSALVIWSGMRMIVR